MIFPCYYCCVGGTVACGTYGGTNDGATGILFTEVYGTGVAGETDGVMTEAGTGALVLFETGTSNFADCTV
jgi:hypothetical protein